MGAPTRRPTGHRDQHPTSGPRPSTWRRALAVVAVAACGFLVVPPVASAHDGGSQGFKAVLEKITPEPAGVALTVETTQLGSQFLIDNPTPTEVTIDSEAGDPFLRVGPEGVFGNFRSPAWYTSKTPEGAATIPPQAKVGREPLWVRVSSEPQWGWFDHRLHGARPTQQQAESGQRFGSWKVPFSYGDQAGSINGSYQSVVRLGNFSSTVTPNEIAPGVRLKALAGGAQGLLLENVAGREVVVLGSEGEPFLKMTKDGTQANELSATWQAAARARGGSVPAVNTDPSAEPRWIEVSGGPVYAWVDDRAAPPTGDPALAKMEEPTDVKKWTIPIMVDGQRFEARGTTTFVPSASLAPRGIVSRYATPVLLTGAVALGGALVVLLVHRRRQSATA